MFSLTCIFGLLNKTAVGTFFSLQPICLQMLTFSPGMDVHILPPAAFAVHCLKTYTFFYSICSRDICLCMTAHSHYRKEPYRGEGVVWGRLHELEDTSSRLRNLLRSRKSTHHRRHSFTGISLQARARWRGGSFCLFMAASMRRLSISPAGGIWLREQGVLYGWRTCPFPVSLPARAYERWRLRVASEVGYQAGL